MHLQVQRVSTGKLCTKMQWEKAIEKIKSTQVQVQTRNRSNVVNSMGKLRCSGQCKHVKTAIKQYTMHSNAQRVIEQEDSLI